MTSEIDIKKDNPYLLMIEHKITFYKHQQYYLT